MENNLSMPELTATLNAKRESDWQERKFLAAIQGVDLDEANTTKETKGNAWQDLKARVFSGGATTDSSDVVSLQGVNARQAGFGIGSGLEYGDYKNGEPKNPFA